MLEGTIAAIEPRPGETVGIPCRSCGKAFLPFTIKEGIHTLVCPRCQGGTRVVVTLGEKAWEVRTSAQGPSPGGV
jgi:hypothetical protein